MLIQLQQYTQVYMPVDRLVLSWLFLEVLKSWEEPEGVEMEKGWEILIFQLGETEKCRPRARKIRDWDPK